MATVLFQAAGESSEPDGSFGRNPRPSSETEVYSIGDLAKEFGVTLRALRFYEDRGLLQPRRQGITRIYSSRDRLRLSMILKGKHLGFTLTEIAAMLDETDTVLDGGRLQLSVVQIDDQIAHLERQIADLNSAIAELRDARARATRLNGD